MAVDNPLAVVAETNSARAVGTPAILQSPDVYEAPESVNRPIPAPSVYVDGRGEIHNVALGRAPHQHRINLLYTKAGVLRSGDLHPLLQHDVIIRGQVRVWTLQPDGTTLQRTYGATDHVSVSPYVPHVFEFLEDTVMAEWWDGPFHAWFYRPYRALVDVSNRMAPEAEAASKPGSTRSVANPPGKLLEYVVRDEARSLSPPLPPPLWQSPRWWTGLAVGVGLGYLLGRRR